MRIGYPGTRFHVHTYEIEITLLFERAYNALDKIPEGRFLKDTSASKIKSDLQSFFEHHYKENELDLNWTAIIIESTDPGYEMFLTIALAFLDPFKIELFLNYQREKYKVAGQNFIGVIEFRIYDIIEGIIPIENTNRKERIMKWVNEARKIEPVKKIIKETPGTQLTWHPKYLGVLNKISKRLWKEKFTKRLGDFQKIFTEGKKIIWNKDAEHLCYLLYKLRTNEPALFKASKGKGHYSVISKFFTENSGKITKKGYITNTTNKFKTRKTGKLIPERNSIDFIIKQSLL